MSTEGDGRGGPSECEAPISAQPVIDIEGVLARLSVVRSIASLAQAMAELTLPPSSLSMNG